MSKLATAVYAKQTGIRATPAPLNAVTVQESWANTYPYDLEFRIGVELTHTIRVAEEASRDGRTLTEATRVAKNAIIEEVFGEFRPHVRAVELAIYKRDFDAALAALRTLEQQMFSVPEWGRCSREIK